MTEPDLDYWRNLAQERLSIMQQDRKNYLVLRDRCRKYEAFLHTIAYTGMTADEAEEHAREALK